MAKNNQKEKEKKRKRGKKKKEGHGGVGGDYLTRAKSSNINIIKWLLESNFIVGKFRERILAASK